MAKQSNCLEHLLHFSVSGSDGPARTFIVGRIYKIREKFSQEKKSICMDLFWPYRWSLRIYPCRLPFSGSSANVFMKPDIHFSRFKWEDEKTPSLTSTMSEGVERIYFWFSKSFFSLRSILAFLSFMVFWGIPTFLANSRSVKPW